MIQQYEPTIESPDLLSWSKSEAGRWPTVVLGNGFSQAVWPGFSYGSLYQVASQQEGGLAPEAVALFEEFGTTNFEDVLSALVTAMRVSSALSEDTETLTDAHRAVQEALGHTVAEVHVPWDRVAGDRLAHIRGQLVRHRSVFTTNYDLLLYWAIMHEGGPAPFKDFMWAGEGRRFDERDTDVWPKGAIPVYYLHGALHLRTTAFPEVTFKVNAAGGDLLSQFARGDSDSAPLLVTEGTAEHKLATIRRSAYLSFAYRGLRETPGPVLLVGLGLGPSDGHLVDALRDRELRGREPIRIGVTVRPREDPFETEQRKQEMAAKFPGASMTFYDARTVPLLTRPGPLRTNEGDKGPDA